MSPDKLNDVTLKFWNMSLERNNRAPDVDKPLSVSKANEIIAEQLDHLNPQRRIAKRYEYLRHYIIIGEKPECPTTSSVSTLRIMP